MSWNFKPVFLIATQASKKNIVDCTVEIEKHSKNIHIPLNLTFFLALALQAAFIGTIGLKFRYHITRHDR